MSNSPAVQAARKQMQLARLAAKADNPETYLEFYANQPYQLVRARKNAEWHEARIKLKAANEVLEVAEITGEGLAAAQEAQAVAALVSERMKPGRPSAAASLAGA